MNIIAKCPRCHTVIQLAESAADRRSRCPQCRRRFKIPSLEQLQKALEAIDGAKATVFVDENGNTYA